MVCVNQHGGYLCAPRTDPVYRTPYMNPYAASLYPPPPAPAPPPNYPTAARTPLICRFGYQMSDSNQCVDVDECASESHQCNPTQICINTEGGYTCSCTDGYWLLEGQCLDIDECRFGYCHQLCANVPGSYSCTCNPGFILNDDGRSCQDVNECTTTNPCVQNCVNTYGSFLCRCDPGYELEADGISCSGSTERNKSHCMCPAENPGCRDQPFTILYRDMDVSGRTVPSDIFQMQATSRYPGAYYIFQIKSGNEGREFYMRQTGPISATLVMTRPLKGPREIELDLEMVTVNTVINFRGSSVIRLRIYVSQYPF
ncbi:fibulin-5 [Sceloporus undulatus]|uniref:fibulin-5 n=1 Tax=Sceloporus undulatus TaxID=8520 RepID=UPI001C4A9B91|nr:fibulin-5 [Sceloporus undulatus]